MKKCLLIFLLAIWSFSCSKDKPEVQPANDDTDFIVVEGEWDLEYREAIRFDSFGQPVDTTWVHYGPGNWLQFISGGVFREFEEGRLAIKGTFTNENNFLILNYHQEVHRNDIEILTAKRLVYSEKIQNYILRTAAVRRN